MWWLSFWCCFRMWHTICNFSFNVCVCICVCAPQKKRPGWCRTKEACITHACSTIESCSTPCRWTRTRTAAFCTLSSRWTPWSQLTPQRGFAVSNNVLCRASCCSVEIEHTSWSRTEDWGGDRVVERALSRTCTLRLICASAVPLNSYCL